MKKIILNLFAVLFLSALCLNVNAQTTTQSDTAGYAKFKRDAEQKIRDNDKRIAELKEKKQEGKKEVVDKYNKKVADIEKKNRDLEKRMRDYKSGNTKWASFKREFNHDMDELGKALKDIGKDNVK